MKDLISYYKNIILESMEHGAREYDGPHDWLNITPTQITPDQIRPTGSSGGPGERPPVRPGTGIRPVKWQPLTPFFDPNTVIYNPRPYVPDRRKR